MTQPSLRTLLARQGIYDKTSSVFAYELLYRNSEIQNQTSALSTVSGELATYSVLLDLFTNLNVEAIVGGKRAFINFTHLHLVQQIPALLPKHKIVIEVLETVAINQQLILSLISLKKQGYQIALDDFIFREELIPLIQIADIIKIDVLNLDREQIQTQLSSLHSFNGKLLAEKIETKSQFDLCLSLGFELFQGFFLDKPQSLQGQAISENKMQILRLLAEINDEDVAVERVEEIILQIPKLSYRILRLANSASIYSSRKVDSLMDAITKLGLNQISHWLSLLLLASHDDMASDLLERTLIRAKMCELLSRAMDYQKPHQAYTVGLLSTLDGILNEPMTSLLEKMGLSEALNEALLNYKGILGKVLKFTMDYEQANFKELESIPVATEVLLNSYLEGIEYANYIMSIIYHPER
ncbi:putative Diguanylate phosphodiesterase (EAL domain) [Legionella quinlivanii]|uniref:Putative Diguanylate phosphodiesterase (EAL domain) n=1 Tax=Legionella quinlivanii TaxID=45073 RepID=A0A0W0XLJ3_9GAMM|nr:HDOD domain-containing protein [Legionella quinlivanii]KTD45455.1 putative Diguanylate phosphodiesterase (EAL domain) [Legionella quinlivanii]MCW8451257.1 HDOD domain-containing protein [Legionella quinlivanii]SEG33250.1 EAL and modified HD-GYP domain-containing signal transduction protein [Legionella quinlivanii DSM 21216]STY10546.1 putative signal transduction protein [Legionella quinlivanii]